MRHALVLAALALVVTGCTKPDAVAPVTTSPAVASATGEATLASVARTGSVNAADEGGCGAHADVAAAEPACGGCAQTDEPSCGALERDEPSCGAHAKASAHGAAHAKAPASFDHAPAHGDNAVCIVMNREFVVDDHTVTSVHAGKTYAFCCGGCKQQFDENPGKYVQADVAPKTTNAL